MTPAAGKEAAARFAAFRKGAGPVDGQEVRSLGERCLISFGSSAGPPMLRSCTTTRIAQKPETLMILLGMIHDARVVRIGGKQTFRGLGSDRKVTERNCLLSDKTGQFTGSRSSLGRSLRGRLRLLRFWSTRRSS